MELVEHRGVYHRCLECLELHGDTHVSFVYLTCLFVGVLGRTRVDLAKLILRQKLKSKRIDYKF